MKTLTINFLRMVFPFFFSNTGEVGTLFLPSESSIENETINYDGFSDYEVEIIDFMIENTKDKLSVKLFKSNPKTALKAYVIQIENKNIETNEFTNKKYYYN